MIDLQQATLAGLVILAFVWGLWIGFCVAGTGRGGGD